MHAVEPGGLASGLAISTTIDPISAEIALYEVPREGETEPALLWRRECSASSTKCALKHVDGELWLSFPQPDIGRLFVLKLMYPGPTAAAPANVASWATRT
ncbi:hypothetical protein [Promicromonospora sukumoe]|uniref:hypothetical protein n=1 Tax=Promicromonospora sukumoe TaxID=88382 RepID=UPI003652B06E